MTSNFKNNSFDHLEKETEKLIDVNKEGFCSYKGVWLPELYRDYAEEIENFLVRDDDVWICTFPKSGTIWGTEIVWCINNYEHLEDAEVIQAERCPWIECSSTRNYSEVLKTFPDLKIREAELRSVEFTKNLPSPRFIRTHLPFHLLPRDLREKRTKAKIVYISRNPKDACISWYHFNQLAYGYSGSLEEFCKRFLADTLYSCPFWEHVLGFWDQRDMYGDRIIFLKYEEIVKDLSSTLSKLARFFKKSPPPPNILPKLLDHLSFEKMKINPSVNFDEWLSFQKKLINHKTEGRFVRSGKIGEWKSAMPLEIAREFDKRTSAVFENTDFTYSKKKSNNVTAIPDEIIRE